MFRSKKLAVIVPTRNRPEKVRNLLTSLSNQTQKPGRILIIASGDDIGMVVAEFSHCLSVEYLFTETGGQIHQRNLGIALLDERTELVASLDDDIVLEPDAIEQMLICWRRTGLGTAGIGFNMTNGMKHKRCFFAEFIGLRPKEPGQVSLSGATTAAGQLQKTLRTQWLCGGATVWRKSALTQNQHKPIKSRWAVYEDVLFSYPIGLKFPLYVCAEAKVLHDHGTAMSSVSLKQAYLMEKNLALWKLYFVQTNRLSLFLYSIDTSATAIGLLLAGLVSFKRSLCVRSGGRLNGLAVGLFTMAGRKDLKDILERVGAQFP